MKGQWEASRDHGKIFEIIDTYILAQSKLKITSAMCLGLGSLSRKEHFREPMIQLVAFESWIERLSKSCPHLLVDR